MSIIKLFVVVLSFFMFSCCNIATVYPDYWSSSDKMLDSVYKSIFKVTYSVGENALFASGFAVEKDYLMTAGHFCNSVLEYEEESGILGEISIDHFDENKNVIKKHNIGIIKVDTQNDICLLYLKDHGLKPLEFIKDYSNVKHGDRVWIVGSPLGCFVADFSGKVVNTGRMGGCRYQGRLVVSAAAAGGNSGSPVVNSRGLVVGMLVASNRMFDHYSVCVQSDVLKKFVNDG